MLLFNFCSDKSRSNMFFPNPYIDYAVGGAVITVLISFIFWLAFKNKKGKKTNSAQITQNKNSLGNKIKFLFRSDKRLEDIVPELEEVLLTADMGIEATEELTAAVLANKNLTTLEQAFEYLQTHLADKLAAKTKFSIDTSNKPYVIYLVGVNGVGKTTTIGKLACQYKKQGHNVLLVAADTFRAAAVEQLRIWSEKNEVGFIGGKTGADPSSVIVDGLRSAKSKGVDVVLVDTAGRLQTKQNLMNELSKMTRMCDKELGKNPEQILLVVDAITGQNGFQQAKIFTEAVDLTGVVLTKYDATSKGGIIFSIVKQTGLPIRYVGFGEGIEDLKEFDQQEFVERIFA
jgi:fused signal recognition particle receptor